MSFEKFFKTDVQLKLAKLTRKKVKNEEDIRTFDELFHALQMAEDRIIELEKQLKGRETSVTIHNGLIYNPGAIVWSTD
jgi:hypothetical protein